MAFFDRIRPHVISIAQEIPVAWRDVLVDAFCSNADPPFDGTPAERNDFAIDVATQRIEDYLFNVMHQHNLAGIYESMKSEIDAG